ncbi:hypothetical protein JB92DRAFT_3014321 [Gautieria morchelliformis]|nr:hypothetical protein JB92DRAFT_3014321 [Gautieria morchelliformis]
MRHTLAESSNTAVAEFQAKFAARVKELAAEEELLADNRRRYQAERETQMLNELSSRPLSRVVPTMVETFVLSQRRCQVAMVNATRLRGTDWKTLCSIRLNVRDLDQLTGESNKLRQSVAALLCTLPPDSLLASALEGLRPVLDMRLENLALSRRLLTTIRDNVRNLQHLESLKVDSEEKPRAHATIA